MGPLLAAGASILGDVVGGLFNQRSANRQMDFQRQMSNTSYQRAVEDLRAAGLNPSLAYQQGGAASPGGSSGSIGNTGSSAVSAATARQQAVENVKLTQAQTKKANAEASVAEADAAFKTGPIQVDSNGRPLKPTYRDELEARRAASIAGDQATTARGPVSVRQALMDLSLSSAKLPEAQAGARYWRAAGVPGYMIRGVGPAVAGAVGGGIIGKFLGGAASSARSADKLFPAPNRRPGTWETLYRKQAAEEARRRNPKR